jgi:flagellar biosynthesis protein FlhF
MKVKTYKAMDMKEALQMIKRDMGPNAVILSSRKVTDGEGTFGILGRPMVEVTAAMDEEAASARGRGASASKARSGRNGDTKDEPINEKDWTMVRDSIKALCNELFEMVHAQRSQTSSSSDELRKNMDEVRWLARLMAQRWGTLGKAFSSTRFRDLYLQLVRNGVRETHAIEIVGRLEAHILSKKSKPADLERHLFSYLSRLVEVKDPLSIFRDKPRVLALIGPTGVGKTTTVAKLAAKWHLDEGKKVGLITNDTYRIAAVEQLRTYARILGIPLEVVIQPSDLPRAIDGLTDNDLILMDTTGRSPFDSKHLGELKEFLDADPRIESLLLLAGNTDPVAMEKAMQCYLPLSPKGLIGTKLDEADSFGAIFSISLQSRLPLTFFTTGQRVPEDLQKASREDVAAWTLWGLPSFYQEQAESKVTG